MIGGLLQTNNQNLIDQLPWLGSVPVLGTLFSSKSYQQNQTDLAIIVTPHLVRPTRPGDVVRTPTDDALPPNDPDFFLLGKAEVTRTEAIALTPVTARIADAGALPFTGHMLDLPKGEFRCGHPLTCSVRSRVAALIATLAGCSEYLDRRDTITLNGGNSVATNEVTQMVDPWPRSSADRNIAFNGEKMETAVNRYRTGRVIPPQASARPPTPNRLRTGRTIHRRSDRR